MMMPSWCVSISRLIVPKMIEDVVLTGSFMDMPVSYCGSHINAASLD